MHLRICYICFKSSSSVFRLHMFDILWNKETYFGKSELSNLSSQPELNRISSCMMFSNLNLKHKLRESTSFVRIYFLFFLKKSGYFIIFIMWNESELYCNQQIICRGDGICRNPKFSPVLICFCFMYFNYLHFTQLYSLHQCMFENICRFM